MSKLFSTEGCWCCFSKNVNYGMVMEIVGRNYIISDYSYDYDTLSIVTYQCICNNCWANGIYDKLACSTNEWIVLCFSEYVSNNKEFFERRVDARKNV